jgi:hypothetical protein
MSWTGQKARPLSTWVEFKCSLFVRPSETKRDLRFLSQLTGERVPTIHRSITTKLAVSLGVVSLLAIATADLSTSDGGSLAAHSIEEIYSKETSTPLGSAANGDSETIFQRDQRFSNIAPVVWTPVAAASPSADGLRMAAAADADWNIAMMGTRPAGATGAGITIAVLDSGITPGLSASVDAAVTGRVDVDESANRIEHGTATAAIINQIAPDAKLIDIVVEGDYGHSPGVMARGINEAVSRGASVINISLASSSPSAIERAAIDDAVSKGVVVVAAAIGSLDSTLHGYPARYPNVIAVGELDADRDYSFGATGLEVDAWAAGVDVEVLVVNALGQAVMTTESGSDIAAAHIAGLAALVRQAHPTWSPENVQAAIELSKGVSPPHESVTVVKVPGPASFSAIAIPDGVEAGIVGDANGFQQHLSYQPPAAIDVDVAVTRCEAFCSSTASWQATTGARLTALWGSRPQSSPVTVAVQVRLSKGSGPVVWATKPRLVSSFPARLPAPTLTAARQGPLGVVVAGVGVEEADGHQLVRQGTPTALAYMDVYANNKLAGAYRVVGSVVGQAIQVRALDEFGRSSTPSAAVVVAAPSTTLSAPTGLNAVQGKDQTITLSWNPVPGASRYLIRDRDSGYFYEERNTSVTQGWYAGETYRFEVAAMIDADTATGSASSPAASFAPFRWMPNLGLPGNVRATVTNLGVYVDWQPASDATRYLVVTRRTSEVTRSSDGHLDLDGTVGDSYDVYSLYKDTIGAGELRSAPVRAVATHPGSTTPPASSTTTAPTTTVPGPTLLPAIPPATPPTTAAPSSSPGVPVVAQASTGYRMLSADGKVFGFGAMSVLAARGAQPSGVAVDIANTSNGYWVLTRTGGIRAFGAAATQPSIKMRKREKAVAIEAAGAQGAYVVTNQGRVVPLGNAKWWGEPSTKVSDIISIAVTASGNGYFLLGSGGTMHSFGDARVVPGAPVKLSGPLVGVTADPDGTGYWLVGGDGSVFAFEAPFGGSMVGTRLTKPVVGLIASPGGYLMAAGDGGVFNFGGQFFGSLGATPPRSPIVAIAN